MTADEDPITTDPNVTGPHGRGWRFMSQGAATRFWMVEAVWAHPVWHSYVLVVASLQATVDFTPTLVLAGATHEIGLWALNPDYPRQKMLDGGEIPVLEPPNFSAQIICATNDAAVELIESTVLDICTGQLSPDTDFRSQWIARFGDNMMRGA